MALVGVLAIATLIRPPERDEAVSSVGSRFDLVAILTWILIVHIALILYLGYYISTALFLVITMFVLGERRWVVLLGVSLVWLIFAYLTFSRLLFVPLPPGRWFETIT